MNNEQAYKDAFAELKRQQDEALAEERKAFVRDAAVRIYAALPWTESPTPSYVYEECWQEASALWASKPWDC